MRKFKAAGAVLAAALLASPGFADAPRVDTPDVAAPPLRAAPIQPAPAAAPQAQPAATPAPAGQTGAITLPPGTSLQLTVPAGYRFYGPDQARAFLQRNNAATPPGEVLGLIAPSSTDIQSPDAWATIIAYDPIGYVPSDGQDALADPGFDAVVRAARVGANRPFEGFALTPAYVDAGANLTWAERSAAPGAGGRDLRHEVRILGRRGVACFTSVGSADQMGAMTAAAPDLVAMLRFSPGAGHVDYAEGDQRSNYDLAGLVTNLPIASENLTAEGASLDGPASGAGGGAGLQGYYPWIALGVAALAGVGYFVMRRFRRREDDEGDDLSDDEDPNLNPQS